MRYEHEEELYFFCAHYVFSGAKPYYNPGFLTAVAIPPPCFDVNQPIEACHGGTESRRKEKNISSVAKRFSHEISEELNVYLKRDN